MVRVTYSLGTQHYWGRARSLSDETLNGVLLKGRVLHSYLFVSTSVSFLSRHMGKTRQGIQMSKNTNTTQPKTRRWNQVPGREKVSFYVCDTHHELRYPHPVYLIQNLAWKHFFISKSFRNALHVWCTIQYDLITARIKGIGVISIVYLAWIRIYYIFYIFRSGVDKK